MTDRIFISHANEDAGVAERIVAYLEARGAPCWIAGRDIPARAIYADAIVEAIDACSACVVLVSKAANESDAIKREIELASHAKKPFIPIRVDGAEPSRGLAYYLRNPQWIEYKRDGERALDRIVAPGGATAPAPRSYAPPPAPPPPAQNNSGRIALIAVAAVVLLGGGWAVWSNMSARQAPTDEATATTSDSTTTARDTSTIDSVAAPESESERARLQKERDEAIARARTAEEGLASERSRREAVERTSRASDGPSAPGAWIIGTWVIESNTHCGGLPWRFRRVGDDIAFEYSGGSGWTLESTLAPTGNPQILRHQRGYTFELSGNNVIRRTSDGTIMCTLRREN